MTNGDSDVNARALGLPASGPGSRAGWGRRIAALFIDWVIANVLVALVIGYVLAVTDRTLSEVWGSSTWLPLVFWLVTVWLSTSLTGASIGQHWLKLRVIRLDRRPVGLLKGGLRTALIGLVIPPLVLDGDGRGLHEVATGTVVVHGPRAV